MNAGKLDRRIDIMRAGSQVDNGFNSVPGAPAVLATRWASWKPANGREAFENMGVEAKAGGTFWVRWDSVTSTITTTDTVAYGGRDWNIVGVQEIGRREGVELIVAAGD
ncbi:head-tail adaptor [Novosphingobium sp. PhB165]|uniref:head-tail adaptor protein n=1 Tax=Novosphingobium sp. PhB165 TaxID=2485105 RepID=UPI00104340D1|nr:head-tail adaptor protein [Novosphingobium sp. PhB165]TCM17211.1 head-tail adaptor [Novosphingobium sp. PhB165]